MMMVVLVPLDVGRPTTRSEKAAAVEGACLWPNPVRETAKLTRDAGAGTINDKIYQFLVYTSGSSAKTSLLGQASVNLAEYAEAFKPSSVSLPLNGSTGALLHVTIQRLVDDDGGREENENGGTITKPERMTLQSQLSRYEDEVDKAANGENYVEDGSVLNKQVPMRFASSRKLPLRVEANGSLHKSHSFDAISASGSDGSSGRFTPKESGFMQMNSFPEPASSLSPLSISDTPKNGSMDGPTNESEIVALTRKVEVSEMELQTLRKQIARERKRGQELSKETNSLRDERDALRRECQELKAARKRTDNGNKESDGGDPWSLLEAIKMELNHEKTLNANLILQLQKTQESNSELDEMLDQKNREISCLRSELSNDSRDMNGRIEQYPKDHEDLEMQMEQLALDYEILKQENHGISSKLEQTQLREQLRMQYECSAHLSIIGDLETRVESLEKELHEQAEAFEADLAAVSLAKVKQEKRAIGAEEELRNAKQNNADAAERLQKEFRALSLQVSSVFDTNERLLVQARREARELLSEKHWLEELQEKNREELELARSHCRRELLQLLNVEKFKSNEKEANIQDDEPTKHQTVQTRNPMLHFKSRNKEFRRDPNSNNRNLQTGNIGAGQYDDGGGGDHKLAEVLEERNESMEAELKEMQERYSEMSVKFAEVEGERQQLVVAVRALRSALKS